MVYTVGSLRIDTCQDPGSKQVLYRIHFMLQQPPHLPHPHPLIIYITTVPLAIPTQPSLT